jgi:hypothetical protein
MPKLYGGKMNHWLIVFEAYDKSPIRRRTVHNAVTRLDPAEWLVVTQEKSSFYTFVLLNAVPISEEGYLKYQEYVKSI